MQMMPLPFRTASIAIAAIALLAIWALGVSAGAGEGSSPEIVAGDESMTAMPEVVLYYFHGTRRCNTCRTIEAYAREAIEGSFGEDLRGGRLGWAALNTDEPENAHFVEDFGLVSSSLVLVDLRAGKIVRHEILQEAWTLVRDKPRFAAYIRDSVGAHLE